MLQTFCSVQNGMVTDVSKFHSVDSTDQAPFFIRFCDGANSEPTVQACKREMLRLMEIRPGMRVLDAGCGTGDDVRTIAALGAEAVGVDVSAVLVEEARRRSTAGDNTSFYVHDICSPPSDLQSFNYANFDVVRCERALMHVPDPVAAVSEFHRILKPGGRAVMFDFEWDALILGGIPREFARKIADACASSFRNSHIGTELKGICLRAGFSPVVTWPVSLQGGPQMASGLLVGLLTKYDAELSSAFERELALSTERGDFFLVSPGIITIAERH